ncbi:MAG TPA: hypothetical protein VLX68_03110 [Chitinivibrionales bacterium]|nr:hypothetical protein [Chitinivibrionales bacterium]
MEHEFDKIELLSYFAGDLPAAKRDAIKRHVASCEQCAGYLASQESEKAAFLREQPFETTAARSSVRHTGKLLLYTRRQAYALAASLILLVGASYLFLSSRPEPGYRIKGETALKLFVKNREGGVEKRAGREYFTGEKIQFLYSCGAKNNFALVSMDTAGAVTVYYPQSRDSSLSLERGQDLPLPNSIALDEYTGRELFIGIFSERPFFVPRLVEKLKISFDRRHSIDSTAIDDKEFTAVPYLLSIQREKR